MPSLQLSEGLELPSCSVGHVTETCAHLWMALINGTNLWPLSQGGSQLGDDGPSPGIPETVPPSTHLARSGPARPHDRDGGDSSDDFEIPDE